MDFLLFFFLLLFLLLLSSPSSSSSSSKHKHSALLSKQPFRPSKPPIIPSFPVQWQSNSCLLNLSPHILSSLKQSCNGDPFISRKKCCPSLAAWLMAARAQVTLSTLTPASPPSIQPLLPDDSLVCVTTMKAVLASHGIPLPFPNAASCNLMTCFCGFRLKSLHCEGISASLDEQKSNHSSSLELNCKKQSYTGCAKCLATLQEVTQDIQSTKGAEKQELDCKLVQMMQLLVKNSTLYIPTVSALLRALLYSGDGVPHCSPDWRYLPLAVDSSELHPSVAPPPYNLLLLGSFYMGLIIFSLILHTV